MTDADREFRTSEQKRLRGIRHDPERIVAELDAIRAELNRIMKSVPILHEEDCTRDEDFECQIERIDRLVQGINGFFG